jgi:hypothetical protein
MDLHESDACWLSASGWCGVLIHLRIHSITLMLSMKAIIAAMAYHASRGEWGGIDVRSLALQAAYHDQAVAGQG